MTDSEHSTPGQRCILCGSIGHFTAIQENGYHCVACENCRLMYVSNKPSEEEITEIYQSVYGGRKGVTQKSLNIASRFHEWHNLSVIRKHAKEGRILELGPGEGQFLEEAKRRGYDVVGIEIDKGAAKEIRDRLGIECRDRPLSIDSDLGPPFDILYHCDVMSHFYNPVEDLRRMHDMLADDGIMVFETGNGAEVSPKYYARLPGFQLPIHLYFFGEESIRRILNYTGYEMVELRRYSLVAEHAIWRLVSILNSNDVSYASDEGNQTYVNPRREMIDANRPSSPRSALRRVLADFTLALLFIMRYPIGCLMPKNGRPQTIIVVARKTPDAQQRYNHENVNMTSHICL